MESMEWGGGIHMGINPGSVKTSWDLRL